MHLVEVETSGQMKITPVRKGFTRGLLTVLGPVRDSKNVHGHRRWRVRCECGRVIEVWGYNLAKTKVPGTKSCGSGPCRKAAAGRSGNAVAEQTVPGNPTKMASYDLETKRIQAELELQRKAKAKP